MLNAIALSQKNAARKKKCIEVAVIERQEKKKQETNKKHDNEQRMHKYLNQ